MYSFLPFSPPVVIGVPSSELGTGHRRCALGERTIERGDTLLTGSYSRETPMPPPPPPRLSATENPPNRRAGFPEDSLSKQRPPAEFSQEE